MRWQMITFDCYGTLIDWNGGIAGAFRDLVEQEGLSGSSEAAVALYHRIEPIVQAETFRSYREVLTETALRVGERMGWSLDRRAYQSFPGSLPSW